MDQFFHPRMYIPLMISTCDFSLRCDNLVIFMVSKYIIYYNKTYFILAIALLLKKIDSVREFVQNYVHHEVQLLVTTTPLNNGNCAYTHNGIDTCFYSFGEG